ncbi:hypothetical protein [Nocardia sp. MW-W600-9]
MENDDGDRNRLVAGEPAVLVQQLLTEKTSLARNEFRSAPTYFLRT